MDIKFLVLLDILKIHAKYLLPQNKEDNTGKESVKNVKITKTEGMKAAESLKRKKKAEAEIEVEKEIGNRKQKNICLMMST